MKSFEDYYAERLEKKCRKNTGMSIYEDISGTLITEIRVKK